MNALLIAVVSFLVVTFVIFLVVGIVTGTERVTRTVSGGRRRTPTIRRPGNPAARRLLTRVLRRVGGSGGRWRGTHGDKHFRLGVCAMGMWVVVRLLAGS